MATTKSFFGTREKNIIAAQGEKLSSTEIRAVENEWPKLIANVRAHLDKGTDPGNAAVQKLARRWMELLGKFDGGNRKIRESTAKLYQEQGNLLGDLFGTDRIPDQKLATYIQKAIAAGKAKK
jgi:hypothetical protein